MSEPRRESQPHISASIMCGDLGALSKEARKLEDAGVDSLHIDVMDGHFVPNITFGAAVVQMLKDATQLPLHVHLMVSDPAGMVKSFADAGADIYFFHLESEPYPLRLMRLIEESGMVPGIALNPVTPLAGLSGIPLGHLLVMTVEPGFAGQRWIPHSAQRLKEARALVGDKTVIAVDGNVSVENAALAQANGASLFVCGTSSLFADDDYAGAVRKIRARLGEQ